MVPHAHFSQSSRRPQRSAALVAKQQMDGDLLRAIRDAAQKRRGLIIAPDQTHGIMRRGKE